LNQFGKFGRFLNGLILHTAELRWSSAHPPHGFLVGVVHVSFPFLNEILKRGTALARFGHINGLGD
jgi:hypothetical protein